METAVAIQNKVPPVVSEMRRYADETRVLSKMGKADRAILAAATGTLVAEYETAALVETLMQMLNFIAMDVGYRKPEEMEWRYLVTRIAEILRRYHSDLTTVDIKTAFELLIVGELDPYLPKNGNGEPDRAHYQAFNADYIAKVVTAYKKRQGETIQKAREIPKETPKALEAGTAQGWDKQGITRRVYDEYVKTNRLNFGCHEDVVVYDYLLELGLIEKAQVTDDDKQKALNHYCMQAELGYRNQYEVKWVKRAGINARELQPMSFTVAIHRIIKTYFDTLKARETKKNN